MEIWLALSATFALAGTVYQATNTFKDQAAAMRFLRTHNQMVNEGRARIRQDVPWWQPLKRRSEYRGVAQDVRGTLNADEREQTRAFDRDSWGWSALSVSALVFTVTSWIQFFTHH